MNYTIEKNEQFALIRLAESQFGEEVSTDFEALSRGLFREGYSNIIVDMTPLESVEQAGLMTIRKINRQCTNEVGLLVLVTKNEELIGFLDAARISDRRSASSAMRYDHPLVITIGHGELPELRPREEELIAAATPLVQALEAEEAVG